MLGVGYGVYCDLGLVLRIRKELCVSRYCSRWKVIWINLCYMEECW